MSFASCLGVAGQLLHPDLVTIKTEDKGTVSIARDSERKISIVQEKNETPLKKKSVMESNYCMTMISGHEYCLA